MSEKERIPVDQITLDGTKLYREEVYTDLRIGTLRRYIPVTADGSPDASRTPVFSAEAQLMSQAGPVPVHANVEANTLEEALAAYPGAIKVAVERMMEEIKELQRREASRIVVPGQEAKGKIELP